MKLRQALALIGLKQRVRVYGHEIKTQIIDGQTIEYAQWLHPKAYQCRVHEGELRRMREILRPGDVAIDIGAHMGDSTLPMALAVGGQGLVIAFEPNAYVFPVLQVNSKLNSDRTHIKPYPFAVTERDCEMCFSYGDPGFMNGGSIEKTRSFRWGNTYIQTVKGVNLDAFLRTHHSAVYSRIRYVKIDAEGYDLFVLRSMLGLLREVHPIVQLEVMRGTPTSYRREIFQLLSQHQYSVQRHLNGLNQPTELTLDDMSYRDNFDIFCTPRLSVASRHAA